jgi:hypothetical protein
MVALDHRRNVVMTRPRAALAGIALPEHDKCQSNASRFTIVTCLVFPSQLHLETPAPLVDLFLHSDMNPMGVL